MHVVICKDPIMEYAGGESCKGGPEESVNSLSILNSPSYRLDGVTYCCPINGEKLFQYSFSASATCQTMPVVHLLLLLLLALLLHHHQLLLLLQLH